jgi:hypothetical protein
VATGVDPAVDTLGRKRARLANYGAGGGLVLTFVLLAAEGSGDSWSWWLGLAVVIVLTQLFAVAAFWLGYRSGSAGAAVIALVLSIPALLMLAWLLLLIAWILSGDSFL